MIFVWWEETLPVTLLKSLLRSGSLLHVGSIRLITA